MKCTISIQSQNANIKNSLKSFSHVFAANICPGYRVTFCYCIYIIVEVSQNTVFGAYKILVDASVNGDYSELVYI